MLCILNRRHWELGEHSWACTGLECGRERWKEALEKCFVVRPIDHAARKAFSTRACLVSSRLQRQWETSEKPAQMQMAGDLILVETTLKKIGVGLVWLWGTDGERRLSPEGVARWRSRHGRAKAAECSLGWK